MTLSLKKNMIMKIFLLLFLSLAISHSEISGTHSAHRIHDAAYAYINGNWFDGKKFIRKTMYSKNGVWIDKSPTKIDSTFDLKNKYIIPPFSEAHTHLLEGIGDYERNIINYLKDGVFYVKNPNNIKPWTEKLKSKINNPNSLDATFANGGLTSTGGHPEPLYEDRIRQHLGALTDNAPRGWFKNKSYFNIDSEKDFIEQWPLIKEGKPDFIKVYLANSEDIGNTPPLTKYTLRKGLSPELVSFIVTKAHQDGFRVSAHIETRMDFLNAVHAGVDEITHTPGFYLFSKDELERYRLKPEDAKLAAKKKVFVITALLSRNLTEDASLLPLVKEIQAYNLALLHNHGVKIAIGSDHAKSPVDEVNALQELNIFDNLAILKMWCEVSPQTIFPDRKLGVFKDGFEASFIALDANPLQDLTAISKISMWFKQGHLLAID
jgi:hypothetical protein